MNEEYIKDVLLAFLHDHGARVIHLETQRSTVSNLLVITAAAILAFVTFDRALTIADLPLTVLLVFIGLFGAGFCVKYHERSAQQYERIRVIRKDLDRILFDSSLLIALKKEADVEHAKNFPRFNDGGSLSWVWISRLWMIFHLCIALLGCILTILIYFV
jgi:hypothetical protein